MAEDWLMKAITLKRKKRMPVCIGYTAFDIATSPRNGLLEDVLEPLILAHLWSRHCLLRPYLSTEGYGH